MDENPNLAFAAVKALLIFLFVIVAPIVGVIVFVVKRNAARRKEQLVGWQKIAEARQGKLTPALSMFDGNKIDFPDGSVLETVLHSVMSAAASPYHSDGGTYMQVRAKFTVKTTEGVVVQVSGATAQPVPDDAKLPAGTRLFDGVGEVVLVMPGAIADPAVLESAIVVATARAAEKSA